MLFRSERRGLGAMRAYFASFKRSSDRQRNFEAAFGESLDAFGEAALARLKTAAAL